MSEKTAVSPQEIVEEWMATLGLEKKGNFPLFILLNNIAVQTSIANNANRAETTAPTMSSASAADLEKLRNKWQSHYDTLLAACPTFAVAVSKAHALSVATIFPKQSQDVSTPSV